MRVCFVAYFNEQKNVGDIGTKNVALALANEISKKHDLLKIDIKDVTSWKKARVFKPDIVHFVLAPTALGFIVAKLFSLYCNGTKVVMSAPNPTLSSKWLLSPLKPHIILIQSVESENFFKSLGFNTKFLPNGVDVNKFVPVPSDIKKRLREKYQMNKARFVILHVGPVIRKRNIERLMELQDETIQVVIVGRKPYDSRLFAELREKGAIIMTDYIDNIEEIYSLSDCYVFPTDPNNRGACIEMPLSVLEAMACNLPIISTEFGALPRVFGDRIEFESFKNIGDLKKKIERIKKNDVKEIEVCEIAASLSWENIGRRLEQIYSEN